MVTPVKTSQAPVPKGTQAYVLGATVGGFFAGICAAILGLLLAWLTTPATLVLVGLACLYGAAADLTKHRIWFPGAKRQVPQFVPQRGPTGMFQFGFEMGTGMRTYMPVALPVVLAVAIALLGYPWIAVAAGTAFGLARGALHVLKWCSGNTEWQDTLTRLSETSWLRIASLSGIAIVAALCAMALGVV